MAIAAVSITPIGEGVSVSRFVAATQEVVHGQDRLRYRLDPMFTTLEGELADIYALIQAMLVGVFAAGARRVSTVIKTDDRRDRRVLMQDMVFSVVAMLRDPGRAGD